MPTLLEYINQLQQEHRYRIKMAFQPTDRQLEVLERHMKKYDALEVSRPEKLMLQAQPMDFPQLGGHEIVIVDVVTRLPISPPSLEAELRGLLFVREGVLKVFGRDEPIEQQIEAEKAEGEYVPLLGSDGAASTEQDLVGDKYNQALLKDLDKTNKERKDSMTVGLNKITTGPEYTGPADGTSSPLSKVTNTMPTAKGMKK
jgi:hypothetical protein